MDAWPMPHRVEAPELPPVAAFSTNNDRTVRANKGFGMPY